MKTDHDLDPWALPTESWTLPGKSDLNELNAKNEDNDTNTKSTDAIIAIQETVNEWNEEEIEDRRLSMDFSQWQPYKGDLSTNQLQVIEVKEEKEKSDSEQCSEAKLDQEDELEIIKRRNIKQEKIEYIKYLRGDIPWAPKKPINTKKRVRNVEETDGENESEDSLFDIKFNASLYDEAKDGEQESRSIVIRASDDEKDEERESILGHLVFYDDDSDDEGSESDDMKGIKRRLVFEE